MKTRFLLVVVVALLAACSSLLPNERQQSQSLKTVESLANQQRMAVESLVKSTPVSTNSAYIHQFKVDTASVQNAGTDKEAKGTFLESLPMGVKLLLLGVGVFAVTASVLFVWSYVSKTALGVGLKKADEVLRTRIATKRVAAQASTNAAEIARLNAEIAEDEADRGRLRM